MGNEHVASGNLPLCVSVLSEEFAVDVPVFIHCDDIYMYITLYSVLNIRRLSTLGCPPNENEESGRYRPVELHSKFVNHQP